MLDITCTAFKPFPKNTLRGFADLIIPSVGLKILGCTYHEKSTSNWIGLPSKEFSKSDGSRRWTPTVDFLDDVAKREFQNAAVQAIKKYLRDGGLG